MTASFPEALAALAPVVDVLERLGVRYHIGGSLASSTHGLPRSSADVDVIAELRPEHVDDLVAALDADYYVDGTHARDAIRSTTSFNLIHLDTMMKVDIFVSEAGEFPRQEQARARPESFGQGESTRIFMVKSPEDLVLRKLLWYRAGGETSERQWSDVVGVLKIRGAQLDGSYLDQWATELQVADLLERARRDAAEA